MSVAGTYDCVTNTPLGRKKGVLTVTPSGDGQFTGNITGDLGTMDIKDGRVDGQALKWSMRMTSPMPMNLDCKATVTGDALTGTIKAGMFGSMELIGTRQTA
ncbi:hypothetical protein [Novosphingobium panipatense]|uniref:Uncharacterized protein n=1 Tax=Novosphingobium panipatense TaxID=428991 RepID=A0ABY1PXW2_9SPHN|nr:hypothetical protein [Novosphingobium panipatense]SMP52493.1 hypothetical protein SAMN06296065_101300 [Novosphingobium panipatense]